MRKSYSQAQLEVTLQIIHIIGDEKMLLILMELINFGEKSFNELKRMTNINQVTLTRKLNSLKEEGYVDSLNKGNENHYFATNKADDLKPLIKDIEKIAKKLC